MPSTRVKGVVGSALAVMGFRGGTGDRWTLSVANEPTVKAELGGTTLMLSAPDAKLSVVVKRPLADDFVPRLRKRLGSLKKRAARAEKATKRASRETLATADALSAALNARREERRSSGEEMYCGAAVRAYDPVAYCDAGKHFTRQSLMVSETECGDCTGWVRRKK